MHSQNAAVRDVAGGDTITWTQYDQGLPLAIDKRPETIEMALRYSDVVKILDQETLRVTGLAAGRYNLQIDRQSVGTFEAEEMGQGINLGLLPTPMVQQSVAVQVHAFKHNYLHQARWRMVEDAFKDDHLGRHEGGSRRPQHTRRAGHRTRASGGPAEATPLPVGGRRLRYCTWRYSWSPARWLQWIGRSSATS